MMCSCQESCGPQRSRQVERTNGQQPLVDDIEARECSAATEAFAAADRLWQQPWLHDLIIQASRQPREPLRLRFQSSWALRATVLWSDADMVRHQPWKYAWRQNSRYLLLANSCVQPRPWQRSQLTCTAAIRIPENRVVMTLSLLSGVGGWTL